MLFFFSLLPNTNDFLKIKSVNYLRIRSCFLVYEALDDDMMTMKGFTMGLCATFDRNEKKEKSFGLSRPH